LRLCHHASPRRAEGKERLLRGRKEGGLLVAEGGKGSPTTQWGRKEPIGGGEIDMVHGDKRGSLAVKGGRGTPTAQWGREEPVGRGRYGAWG
jgi:hypothetical protein